MNECPVCGAAKTRMERHLVDVHGFSQNQIVKFKAQKKSQRITASGKPINNCDYCDTTFNSVTEKVDGVTVEHCFNYLEHEIVSLLRDGLTSQEMM
ncbi:hypothetical protein RB195_023979 [Necator americanus]|uniref:Zinc finger, C2H2 type n=1 Tax=Necator americanus TaxID=51031 RepID=A0ABR1ELD2_NECAM